MKSLYKNINQIKTVPKIKLRIAPREDIQNKSETKAEEIIEYKSLNFIFFSSIRVIEINNMLGISNIFEMIFTLLVRPKKLLSFATKIPCAKKGKKTNKV